MEASHYGFETGDRQGELGSCHHGPACTAARASTLKVLRRPQSPSVKITIWDLPHLTGLSLHAAFTAVRELEAARLLCLRDNPFDLFGATLELASRPRPAPPEPLPTFYEI